MPKRYFARLICLAAGCLLGMGCASWREEINFEMKAEQQHFEPHEERRQQLYDMSQPR